MIDNTTAYSCKMFWCNHLPSNIYMYVRMYVYLLLDRYLCPRAYENDQPYVNRQKIGRPLVRLLQQRAATSGWWRSFAFRGLGEALFARPFRRHSALCRHRRDVGADSQGKRIDVDYVCPKDQTEYVHRNLPTDRIKSTASPRPTEYLCLHSRLPL